MLKTIKYDVTFASTMRTIKGNFDIDNGMTAITGPNESGKSMVIEMIRYALFGTKALRGASSGYKSLKSELTFLLPLQSDDAYTVKRNKTGSDCLLQNDKTIVSGTKPVNEAIEKLLGYNLEVFDVSNACLQGQVEALSDKTPAERKRMVERTIGLDAIEKVIKHVNNEMSSNKRTVEALESTLQSLQEPEKPEGYVAEPKRTEKLERGEREFKEFTELNAWMQSNSIEEPVAPTVTIQEPLQSLQLKQEKYNEIKTRINYLTAKMEALPSTCSVTDEKSLQEREEKLQAWNQYQELVLRYPEPPRTQEWIDEQRLWIKNRELSEQKVTLQKNIELEEEHSITCPLCDGEFARGHERLRDLKAELAFIPATTPFGEIKANEHELKMYEDMIHAYSCRPDIVEVEKPDDTEMLLMKDIAQFKLHQEYLDLRTELHAQEDACKFMVDLTDMIETKKEETRALESYGVILGQYNEFMEKKDVVEQRLKELSGIDKEIQFWRIQASRFAVYDSEYKSYEQQQKIMDERQKEIETLKKSINRDENVKNGLKDLKPKVKMFLVPSLNKVSSMLISEMTKGERNKVEIDEQFNIKIDGQAIEELSGSGKAVANLAIRIGLGTVLTNKVFSVFLADEIDAAMDKDRASYTAECLRNLKSTIGQIVIVSHQKPDADHQIELRK